MDGDEKMKMTPCSEKWCNHIDITNKCHIGDCSYCSRYIRHIPQEKRYEMSLEDIDKALDAYKGMRGLIGIMGGEPLTHPKFAEICELIRLKYPPEKMHLFTSINPNLSKFRDEVYKTFRHVAVNEHTMFQNSVGLHQPFTLAVRDMVENEELRIELIKDCWFGKNWCGTVTPLGAYHCEIGASIAYALGVKGWDVEPRWWERGDIGEQEMFCQLCGACIPMERQAPVNKKQKMSVSVYQILSENDLIVGDIELVTKPFTVEYMAKWAKIWAPGNYRGDIDQGEALGSNIDWGKWDGKVKKETA